MKSIIITKSKPFQSLIQIIPQVHIVINDLGLTYQSPEGVDTEDYYLSRKEDDGKCLYDTQSGSL